MSADQVLVQPPLLTADIPGTGGTLRAQPEDFEVEELPAYEPSRSGDHLFLWVEKRGRTTREVAQFLARALGIGERDVGFAGLKDKRAKTRQFFSVPLHPRVEARLEEVLRPEAFDGVRVLSHARHGNKLKTGHLRGNRFRIRLRDVHPEALPWAQAAVERLRQCGLANAFGPQRFGRDGLNAERGRAIVLRQECPDLGRVKRDRFLRRLCVSAYQSLLFNRVLAERVAEGLFERAIDGDLMKKLDTGGLFTSRNPDEDTPRLKRFDIAPTGPIFGHKMMRPESSAWERESRVLAAEGLDLAAFAHLRADAEGSRRPLRIPIEVAVSSEDPGTLLLDFALPKGAFATALLREVMKDAVALPDELDAG